jgi:hypothetical protein
VPDGDTETSEWASAELEAAHTTAAPEVIDAEIEPDPPPRRSYGPPTVTGLDAIAEAARCRELPESPPPPALPAARRR